MNTLNNLLALLLIPAALMVSVSAHAQSNFNLLDDESSVRITGTSTIHDWESTVEEMNFSAVFAGSLADRSIPASADFIQSLSLEIPVSSIESGKRAMNSKMHEALKERNHPTIRFQYMSGSIAGSNSADGSFTIDASGTLTIAGVTKTVTFPVQGSYDASGNLVFSGIYRTNMRDYNVDPPTAMLGTIRAGEEVAIAFNLVLATN